MAQQPDQSEDRFPATDADVRSALLRARRRAEAWGLGDDLCGSAELILAEVLNNITEHAYGNAGNRTDASPAARAAALQPDAVCLTMIRRPGGLRVELSDQGCAMPGLGLPRSSLPDHEVPLEVLPEGGFGWFLIRSLTRDLRYDRTGGQNRLRFDIPDMGSRGAK